MRASIKLKNIKIYIILFVLCALLSGTSNFLLLITLSDLFTAFNENLQKIRFITIKAFVFSLFNIFISYCMFFVFSKISTKILSSRIQEIAHKDEKYYNRFTIDYQRMVGALGSTFIQFTNHFVIAISSMVYIVTDIRIEYKFIIILFFFLLSFMLYSHWITQKMLNIGEQILKFNNLWKDHVRFFESFAESPPLNTKYIQRMTNSANSLYTTISKQGFFSQLFQKYTELNVIVLIALIISFDLQETVSQVDAGLVFALYKAYPVIGSSFALNNQYRLNIATFKYFKMVCDKKSPGYLRFIKQADVLGDLFDAISNKNLIRLSGASGSGKSTLLQNLHLELKKKEIPHIYVTQRSKVPPLSFEELSTVFQDNEIQSTVLSDVLGFKRETIVRARENLINQFDFSGGEYQRFNLLMYLSTDIKLILFDEAFSALDEYRQNKILSYLSSNGYYGVVVSHSENMYELDYELRI